MAFRRAGGLSRLAARLRGGGGGRVFSRTGGEVRPPPRRRVCIRRRLGGRRRAAEAEAEAASAGLGRASFSSEVLVLGPQRSRPRPRAACFGGARGGASGPRDAASWFFPARRALGDSRRITRARRGGGARVPERARERAPAPVGQTARRGPAGSAIAAGGGRAGAHRGVRVAARLLREVDVSEIRPGRRAGRAARPSGARGAAPRRGRIPRATRGTPRGTSAWPRRAWLCAGGDDARGVGRRRRKSARGRKNEKEPFFARCPFRRTRLSRQPRRRRRHRDTAVAARVPPRRRRRGARFAGAMRA